MREFEQLTIIVLATTEQETLKETVRLIGENCNSADIAEVILFVLSDDCPSAAVAKEIIADNPYHFRMRYELQKNPGLNMTIYEVPKLVHSSHLLGIGSDLEMDPTTIPKMIEVSKQHPEAIVCASKFLKESHRENYGFFHCLCNRAVNKAMEIILNIKGTELMSFYQIFPKDLFDSSHFSTPDRVYYEYTIRPILEGAEYIEVPTDYVRRTEGDSNYNLFRYIDLAFNFLSISFHERRRIKRKQKNNKG